MTTHTTIKERMIIAKSIRNDNKELILGSDTQTYSHPHHCLFDGEWMDGWRQYFTQCDNDMDPGLKSAAVHRWSHSLGVISGQRSGEGRDHQT